MVGMAKTTVGSMACLRNPKREKGTGTHIGNWVTGFAGTDVRNQDANGGCRE